MHRSLRKPLIVMTPKSLLRAKPAYSKTSEFESGHFHETLDDPFVPEPENVRWIMVCTGKIAYSLMAERDKREAPVAVVRVEQLYPFPRDQLAEIFDRYPSADEVRWVQDEPENMGAWSFAHARLHSFLPDRFKLSHASRQESASPATGSSHIHEQEHAALIERAFTDII
jgi:2-oxoglutarate dehydrogenase E1 component